VAEIKGIGFLAGGQIFDDALSEGMIAAAVDIMNESLIQVPVDTGTLRGSATGVSSPDAGVIDSLGEFIVEQTSEGSQITFGYAIGEKGGLVNPVTGRAVDEYAIDVHEITDVFHKEPTKAKFLEDPTFEYETRLEQTLALTIIEEMK
jgi:hypothetical protein